MGYLDDAGLTHLWAKVKAKLGLKMDKNTYDPQGRAQDVFAYADGRAAAAEAAAKSASRPAAWMPTAEEVGAAEASHVDDAVKHVTAEERTAWNGKAAASRAVNVTLLPASWTNRPGRPDIDIPGSTGPYTHEISVPGLLAESNGDIGLAQSATAEQRAAARAAMLCVTGQADGSLTVTADGERPTVDIPVTVTILG